MENIEAKLDVGVQREASRQLNGNDENQELFPYNNQEEIQITLLYLSMVDNNPSNQNNRTKWLEESMRVLESREKIHRERYSNHRFSINPAKTPSEFDKTFDNSFYIKEKNRILDNYN